MNPPEPNSDPRLRELLGRFPPTPELEGRVKARLRRRRIVRRSALGLAASLLIVSLAGVPFLWRPAEQSGPIEQPAALANGWNELTPLAAPPPVASLAVLDRQQSAFLRVLEEVVKEK